MTTTKFLDRCTAGDTVLHPHYGPAVVVRNVNRGAATNLTGFPPGTYIRPLTGARAGEEFPVYGGTVVEVAPAARVYADDRDPSDQCEASTPGCSVNHTLDRTEQGCEGW